MLVVKRFRHKAARTRLRVPLIWFRNRGLDANDVFIASYPRGGSTWTRFVLYELLSGESSSFDNVNRGIPEIGIHWHAKPLLPGEGRLIKTHEPYRSEYRRAIYLVRDMRELCPGVPPALEALVMALLDRDPARRPGSAAEVGAALRAIFA